ncbi:MAG: gluconate 2-dehydrogenase subunit 3 family protein [Opitutus sp.]|nr:gluconate 2-dehydrogenase subunit 3 family protein [Opitutus sp.]
MLSATATIAILDRGSFAASAPAAAKGYGTDPDLLKDYKPGDLWPLTFTEQQRLIAAALCDVIIPADAKSPAASTLHVPEFIDEWISAPYPDHVTDRGTVLNGLAWLDAESKKRFGAEFADLVLKQKTAICDDICSQAKAKPEFKTAAHFFKKYRELTAGGFYSTPEGSKDIGYVGNVPIATFDGPTPAALKFLGLT